MGFKKTWFVFRYDSPIHPHTISSKKKEYAEKSGVKRIRLHDFRHSCASLLINNGANIIIVAKYLGHAKIDETLNTYAHLFKTKMNEIVNFLDKLEEEYNTNNVNIVSDMNLDKLYGITEKDYELIKN